MSKPPEGSQYINDGVYAKTDPFGVWLYVYDGYAVTDTIYLEEESISTIKRLWDAQFSQDADDA